MIEGIFLKKSHEKERLLWDILNCIDVSKYNWYNIYEQMEAWSIDDGEKKDFLENVYYEGKNFEKIIYKKHEIIFLKIEAYLEKINDFDIHIYEDFKNSTCKILILIYDNEFIEIFAKEENLIKKIYTNAVKEHFAEIEYITELNRKRTLLDVL